MAEHLHADQRSGAALTHLPAQPTPLIGRDGACQDVQRLMLEPDVRLLTLTGAAGIGKTRLALHVAVGLQERFDHGVSLVDLSLTFDPSLLPHLIAQTLDLSTERDESALDVLCHHLRTKHLLLVLDNFEQLAPSAPMIAELLASCPDLKVLATSRSPLHLRWEHEYPVPPLALPESGAPLAPELLMESPAVALFFELARAVQPAFSLDAHNCLAVAEI